MTRKQAILIAPAVVMAGASLLAYLNRIPGGWFHSPWDKAAHAILYGWLAACAAAALPDRRRHWALAGPLLLGIADELTQSLARHRSSDIVDLAADAAGITLAYACANWHSGHTAPARPAAP